MSPAIILPMLAVTVGAFAVGYLVAVLQEVDRARRRARHRQVIAARPPLPGTGFQRYVSGQVMAVGAVPPKITPADRIPPAAPATPREFSTRDIEEPTE